MVIAAAPWCCMVIAANTVCDDHAEFLTGKKYLQAIFVCKTLTTDVSGWLYTLHELQLSQTKDWHHETIEMISVIVAPKQWSYIVQ